MRCCDRRTPELWVFDQGVEREDQQISREDTPELATSTPGTTNKLANSDVVGRVAADSHPGVVPWEKLTTVIDAAAAAIRAVDPREPFLLWAVVVR